jgi:hypothetical protein
MGQFKPMVKMETTEPSVILKLKKGGKVEKKAGGGFMPMQSTMPAQMPVGMPARGGMAPAASPMKPSMAMRRRAMNPTMMKKGGKAEKHDDAAQDRAMIKKAMAGKKFADGGNVTASMAKTTVKGNVGKFAKTMVVDGDKNDSAKGTGNVKNGNAGGYANGGTIKGNVGKFAKTDMETAQYGSGAKKGSGDVKMGNGGGYAKGGKVDWENRPADTAKAGVTGTSTGGVRNSNAGGYKKGGSTKKAYATGGTVDTGKAVAMPKKPISRPVANSLQSGTFKKGGEVKKYADGSSVKPVDDAKAISDKASRELEEALNPLSMLKEGYGKIRDYFTSKPEPAGSVTKTEKSVTVSPKKRGGRA